MSIVTSLDPTAQASANSVTFKQLNLETTPAQRPEVIAVLGQAADAKTVAANTPVLSDGTQSQAFALYGASPLYYAATKLYPDSGNGAKVPVWYVPVAVGTGVVDAQTITVAGTESTKAFTARLIFRELPSASAADAVGKIATNAQSNPARGPRNVRLDGFNTLGVQVAIAKGDDLEGISGKIVAAVNAEAEFPSSATDIPGGSATLTAKWGGAYGTLVYDLVDSDGNALTTAEHGITATVAEDTPGSGTFDIEDALANLTANYNVTRVINQFDDDTNLDLAQAWGEGKRDSLIAQYAMVYSGREYPESGTVAGTIDIAAVKALGDARLNDPVNSWLYGQYGDLRELEYTQRDSLLKSGISNIEVRNGVRYLMDSVTLYHPTGVRNPIFQYDDSICKEGNIAYDLLTYFGSEEWESKIIVSVDSKTTNPEAIDINDYIAAVNGRAELWEKTALIASAKFVKENIAAEIDGSNPRRINGNIKEQLTSTLAILDNTLYTGFLFGESA